MEPSSHILSAAHEVKQEEQSSAASRLVFILMYLFVYLFITTEPLFCSFQVSVFIVLLQLKSVLYYY